MMTSRSEYRLILRQDNADQRLTPIGRELGLISDERWENYLNKLEKIKQEKSRINKINIKPSEKLNKILVSRETSEVNTGIKLSELLKRPQINYYDLNEIDIERPNLSYEVIEQVEIDLKYEGYIKKQLSQVELMRKLEKKVLSKTIDYNSIVGLRLEAREKLNKIKPLNIGQASRISGVNPADISVLLIWLEQKNRGNINE